MEHNPTQQLIQDRLKEIPSELRLFLISEELKRKIGLIAKKYRLTSDQETLLQNEISFILLVLDSVSELPKHLIEELKVSQENSTNIAKDVEEYIFKKVSKYLVYEKSSLVLEEAEKPLDQKKTLSQNSLMRQSVSSFSSNKNDQNPTKASLLSEIENPHRTVIKKYVIEHEPITDPEHIIDDTIDTRPRLEQ